MNTQIIFNIDKTLKDKAMKKAKSEGIAFAFILKLATKAFVNGDLDISLTQKEDFNPKTRKLIRQAIKDIKEGKNLSPAFTHAKDAVVYLENL